MVYKELIEQYNNYMNSENKLPCKENIGDGQYTIYEFALTESISSSKITSIGSIVYLRIPGIVGYSPVGSIGFEFECKGIGFDVEPIYLNSTITVPNTEVNKECIGNMLENLGYSFYCNLGDRLAYKKKTEETKDFEYYHKSIRKLSAYLLNYISLTKSISGE